MISFAVIAGHQRWLFNSIYEHPKRTSSPESHLDDKTVIWSRLLFIVDVIISVTAWPLLVICGWVSARHDQATASRLRVDSCREHRPKTCANCILKKVRPTKTMPDRRIDDTVTKTVCLWWHCFSLWTCLMELYQKIKPQLNKFHPTMLCSVSELRNVLRSYTNNLGLAATAVKGRWF